ncbi:hypothetical protein F7725_006126 [Dissostichus mawsoni]|uniref:Ectonucleoside triphosphate diphosphohydrolase 7 n=1 Tax=Dissostichus mawsoni TaxID=36200 RepID=A0A7J5YVB7_DISMA|nr:hypothetical protein F7725_006126 [Dissostichus mawsoni]
MLKTLLCSLPRQKESLNSGPGPDHSADTMRITFSCLPASWHCSVSLLSLGCAPRQRLLLLLFITSTLLLLGTYQRQLWGLGQQRRPGHRVNKYLSIAETMEATDVLNPALNYGVVVDWISTLATSPTRASDYLYPLLSFAAAHVPRNKHKETPLYILCTAGMRLLPDSQQTAILEDLITDVPLDFDFLFSSSHAEVISGKQEEEATVEVTTGSQNQQPISRRRTVGIMDMGGASLQIAYEVPSAITFSSPQEEEAGKSVLAEFNLGCDVEHTQHVYRVYAPDHAAGSERGQAVPGPVSPAQSAGQRGERESDPEPQRAGGLDPVPGGRQTLPGIHNGTMSPGGVYQAPINFSNSEFYGFSEFFYCTEDVLRLGGQYDSRKYSKAAMDYCATKWSTLKQRLDNKLSLSRPTSADSMLQVGLDVRGAALRLQIPPDYRSLRTAQLVYDKEVQGLWEPFCSKHASCPSGTSSRRPSVRTTPAGCAPPSSNHHLFSLCVLVVVLAILLYILRLRRIHQREQRQSETLKLLWAEEGRRCWPERGGSNT